MGSISLIKPQQEAAEPMRVALAALLQEMGDAFAAVEKHKAAIERARFNVRSGEKLVKAAEEAVTTAQRTYADELAAAASDDAASPPSGFRAARQDVINAQDELEAGKLAYAQLKADLPSWENAARESDVAVEAAISAILAVSARQILDRAYELGRQLTPLKNILAALWNERAPTTAEYQAFDRGRRPLAEAKASAATFFQAIKMIDDKSDIWRVARERLRADPFCELPDLDPPAPNDAA